MSHNVAPPLSEAHFLRQVTELADIYGWKWLHLRPGMTQYGWRTPISGPLGKGYPDLMLVRGSEIMWMELKSDDGKVTPEQEVVIAVLGEVGLSATLISTNRARRPR